MASLVNSTWLGRARKPVRAVMIAAASAISLLYIVLIISRLFFGAEIDLKTFLFPSENPVVLITLLVGLTTVISVGIYFSDRRAAIEIKPEGFFDIFSLVWGRMSMIAIVAILLVMFYEVVSRYVFIKPTLWANELSIWLAALVFLMSGLYAMQQRAHIRIYIIYDKFPTWGRRVSDTVSVALIWIFAISLTWGGFNEARDKFFRGETMGTAWDPPIPATVKPAILIVVAFVAIQALSNLIADWNKAPESHTPLDDIDQSEIEQMRKFVKD